jgi:hypothetical protein
MPGGAGKLIWTQAASATTAMPWAGNKLELDGSSTPVENGASVTIGRQPVLLRNF